MCFTKALLWSHLSTWPLSPRRILASSGTFLANSSLAFLCLCVSRGVLMGLLPKPPISFRWRRIVWADMLYPESAGQLEFVWKLIKALYAPFQQSFCCNLSSIFSLPSTSREVSYSAMGSKLLDGVAHIGHRNIKISGDGLVALRLSMLVHNFGSQIIRQFFALLSFLHAQYGTHRHTTQRLSQLFSILTGCKCDFYITSTCFLPQVSLNTN